MRIAVGLLLLTAALGVAEAGETGWRTDGTGRYPDAKPPVTFAPGENVVWATPLPSWSNASPVLVEDRIFVCAEPDTLPDVLELTAQTERGEIMGVRHKTLPLEGVQFHPESVLTPEGDRLMANFMRMTAA